MRIAFLAVIALLAVQSECNQAPSKPQAPPPQRTIAPIRRFVLARPQTDVAFDTQTGQLCRTWEWSPALTNEKQPWVEMKPGQFTPLCVELYKKYPTTGATGVTISDDSN